MAEQFLPGQSAILVFIDEFGKSRSSIVEVVTNHDVIGQSWYAVKGKQEIFEIIGHVAPLLEVSNTDVEEGLKIGLVQGDLLQPIGTRTFHIVQ